MVWGRRRPGTRTTVDGVNFRSKFEASVAADLTARGIVWEYESLRVCYELPKVWIPDFIVGAPLLVIEAKGYFPIEDRRKLIEVKRANPELDVRIIFQRDGKLGTGPRPMTCLKWAKKHGFPAAVGTVPAEWLENDNE